MKRIPGFTIIELLIAVALTVVLGLLVSMAFTNTQKASQRINTQMRLQQKGRAIMDLLARDLANMAYDSSITASAPAPVIAAGSTNDELLFKTYIPIQRSKFSNTTTAAAGFYEHDVAAVKWSFTDSVTIAGKSVSNVLFRKILTPTEVSSKDIPTVLALTTSTDSSFLSDNSNMWQRENVVTVGDIRDFSFKPVYSSGTVISGYAVSFALTDAPVDATESSSYDGDTIINSAREAEDDGYIWLEFKRTIRTPNHP